VKFGAQLWSQQTTWPEWRDAALAAEAAGWDSIWTWESPARDLRAVGAADLRGWSLLSATAAITSKVRLGLMVGANTFRNPGLTAEDCDDRRQRQQWPSDRRHRGAWFEREHDAFGIETWGSGFGERLEPTRRGGHAPAPPPRRRAVRPRGAGSTSSATPSAGPGRSNPISQFSSAESGPTKTLRTVALRADAWEHLGHGRGGPGQARHARRALRDGRAASLVHRLDVSFPITIRNTVESAEAAYAELLAANGATTWPRTRSCSGRRRSSPRRSLRTAISGSGP